ncbi:hypothetical protein D3C76_1136880 [compost metagenome]
MQSKEVSLQPVANILRYRYPDTTQHLLNQRNEVMRMPLIVNQYAWVRMESFGSI